VIQGWKGLNNIPLAEVKMDNNLAIRLRKQFAMKKKLAMDLAKYIHQLRQDDLCNKERLKWPSEVSYSKIL
jgi:hypothetical protein